MVRFGQSTRWFILIGPEELQDNPESEETQKKLNIVSKS